LPWRQVDHLVEASMRLLFESALLRFACRVKRLGVGGCVRWRRVETFENILPLRLTSGVHVRLECLDE